MPEWLDNAIFYQIYPQSFYDTNSDGIGDIDGIIKKLDYIQNIGFNAIWLNPCFCSPFGDAGYDVSDYCKVAERYGTNEDLIRLFEEVHKRKMHIILDLVPGHTSVEHPWFKESMKAEKNEYTDRYIWTDTVWESPDGMACIRGISERDGSCATNFFSMQPALNYGFAEPTKPWQKDCNSKEAKATKEAIKNVMRFWLKAGCDGFRVDMAGSLVKNDFSGKENIQLWKEFRKFLDEEFPDAVMISEWGEPDKSIEGGFHMDFLLQFGPQGYNSLFRCENPFFSEKGKGDSNVFIDQYTSYYKLTHKKGYICIPSGNHDSDRLARGRNEKELKVCFAFLMTMAGVPFVYYGDEIGMRYIEGLTSVEGGYGRTGSRSPMQWDKSQINDGFSSSAPDKLYIPMDKSENRPCVNEQLEDENSLLNEVKALIRLRQSHKALQSDGEISFIRAKRKYPMIYRRSDDTEDLIIVINPSGKELVCRVDTGDKTFKVLHSVNAETSFENGSLVIPPVSATIFSLVDAE